MKQIKQNLWNSNGLTMIQVLIAAAMMGGLALVFSQMMANQARESKTIKVNADIAQWKNTILSILSKNDLCNASFAGRTGGASPSGTSLTGLKSSGSGNYVIEKDVPSPNGARVSSIKLIRPSSLDGTRGLFNLEVTFSKEREDSPAKRTTIGPETIKETFEFFARPCSLGITDPNDGMLKYESVDLAVSQCDSNCEEIAGLISGLGSSAITNCDCVPDNAESIEIGGLNSWMISVYYNCAVDASIAACDNAND